MVNASFECMGKLIVTRAAFAGCVGVVEHEEMNKNEGGDEGR